MGLCLYRRCVCVWEVVCMPGGWKCWMNSLLPPPSTQDNWTKDSRKHNHTSRKQPCVAAHPGMWLKAFIPCQFWIETGTVGSFCKTHTRPRGLHCCFPLLTQREITLGCLDTQNHSHQNRTLTTLQYLHHYATSLSKSLALQRSTVCLHFPLQYIESAMPYYTAKDRSPAAVFIG